MGHSLGSKAIENLKSLDNVRIDDRKKATKPRIPKVPDVMRNQQNFNKYFEPRLVSVGPYHHENQNLKVTQEMKLKLAAMFIKEHKINKENLYLNIIMQIENLRRCYELDATLCYDDEDLAWIFLIDGCLVLHYIYVVEQSETEDKFERLEILKFKGLEIVVDFAEDIKFTMDLLLLENQPPYQVLKLLIHSSEKREKLKILVQHFIDTVTYNGLNYQLQEPPEDPHHLLYLMRSFLIQSLPKKSNFIVQRLKQWKMKFIDMISVTLSHLVVVLLDILPYSPALDLTSLRSIVELKDAAIKFKSSGTCYLTDISFSCGTLNLPSILVNKLTAFKFLNLVAYEMCLNSPTKFEVSAYIYFLASLIVRAEVVKGLRVKGILLHVIDSDEHIVKLFKEIRTDDMYLSFEENYCGIMEEIHSHCSKRYNAWIA